MDNGQLRFALEEDGGVPQRDAVAINKADFVTVFNGLAIYKGLVFVLVVAERTLQGAIGQTGYIDNGMLSTHIAVGSGYLKGGLRSRGLAPYDILPYFQRIGFAIVGK